MDGLYFGKSRQIGWFRGAPIYGNLHIYDDTQYIKRLVKGPNLNRRQSLMPAEKKSLAAYLSFDVFCIYL